MSAAAKIAPLVAASRPERRRVDHERERGDEDERDQHRELQRHPVQRAAVEGGGEHRRPQDAEPGLGPLVRARAHRRVCIGERPDDGERRPAATSVRRERKQGDVPRPLDGQGQLALVLGAGAEHPARQDLAPLGDEPREQLHVLVVDVVDLVRAELADLAAPEEIALALVLVAARPPFAPPGPPRPPPPDRPPPPPPGRPPPKLTGPPPRNQAPRASSPAAEPPGRAPCASRLPPPGASAGGRPSSAPRRRARS